jgi:hypothetical protein
MVVAAGCGRSAAEVTDRSAVVGDRASVAAVAAGDSLAGSFDVANAGLTDDRVDVPQRAALDRGAGGTDDTASIVSLPSPLDDEDDDPIAGGESTQPAPYQVVPVIVQVVTPLHADLEALGHVPRS